MRLMDVDAYIKEHEEQYKYSDHYETEYFWDGLINAPTIDAVPVERVAELLEKFAGLPCTYIDCDDSNWCKENCPTESLKAPGVECWLQALKEGGRY